MRPDDDFEPLSDDLDLASERPRGATMRGSALATFMAAAVITTAVGLGGAVAITSAARPEPIRPRFSFTSAPWSISTATTPAPRIVLVRPLSDSLSDVAWETGHETTAIVTSLGTLVAGVTDRAIATAGSLAKPAEPAKPARISTPKSAAKPVPKAAAKPPSQAPAKPKAKPIEAPEEEDLLRGLPGVEALEATARTIQESNAAAEPASIPDEAAAADPVPTDGSGFEPPLPSSSVGPS